jgi:hypothetical protein
MLALLLSFALVDTSHDFHSGYHSHGVSVPDGKVPVFHEMNLSFKLKGEFGQGTLSLNPNPPTYDQFGNETPGSERPWTKMNCQLRYVKSDKYTYWYRLNRFSEQQSATEEWSFYTLTVEKMTCKMTLVMEKSKGESLGRGRILILDDKGSVKQVIRLSPPPQPEPCHPGCFPAGTRITTPNGTVPVEKLQVGDELTTMQGKEQTTARIKTVFITRNRLYEVHTEAGMLLTTETQPLSLSSGALCAVGELKAGMEIERWGKGQRIATKVLRVEKTARHETVYNVVLGDPTLFIANGYLARSKPPAE